jgi:hypothetical protein
VQEHELLRAIDAERREQHRTDHREHGGVRADADPQRQDRDGRETR